MDMHTFQKQKVLPLCLGLGLLVYAAELTRICMHAKLEENINCIFVLVFEPKKSAGRNGLMILLIGERGEADKMLIGLK